MTSGTRYLLAISTSIPEVRGVLREMSSPLAMTPAMYEQHVATLASLTPDPRAYAGADIDAAVAEVARQPVRHAASPEAPRDRMREALAEQRARQAGR